MAAFLAALRRPKTWLIGIPALLLIAALVGPFAYSRMIGSSNPEPLSFNDLAATTDTTTAMPVDAATPAEPTTTVAPPAPSTVVAPPVVPPPSTSMRAAPTAFVSGTWIVGRGADARYGIDDTILGQTTRVVGRTTNVSGNAQVAGLTVMTLRVVVNMQSVRCNCIHDPMYNQMLETPKYTTAVFTLSKPIPLPADPVEGSITAVPVTGTFTIHGNTRTKSFNLQVTKVGGRFAAKGSIPVSMEEFDIRQPEGGGLARVHSAAIEILIPFDKTGQ